MINYSIVIRSTKPGTKTEDITETKAYGVAQLSDILTINDFAKHIAEHGTLYSRDVIQGVLIKMVDCMRELLLEGKNVKIDDLAIFSLGIKNTKGGAESEDDFTVSKNITGVKLRARATGTLMAKNLNLEATLKRATAISGKQTGTGGESVDVPSEP